MSVQHGHFESCIDALLARGPARKGRFAARGAPAVMALTDKSTRRRRPGHARTGRMPDGSVGCRLLVRRRRPRRARARPVCMDSYLRGAGRARAARSSLRARCPLRARYPRLLRMCPPSGADGSVRGWLLRAVVDLFDNPERHLPVALGACASAAMPGCLSRIFLRKVQPGLLQRSASPAPQVLTTRPIAARAVRPRAARPHAHELPTPHVRRPKQAPPERRPSDARAPPERRPSDVRAPPGARRAPSVCISCATGATARQTPTAMDNSRRRPHRLRRLHGLRPPLALRCLPRRHGLRRHCLRRPHTLCTTFSTLR